MVQEGVAESLRLDLALARDVIRAEDDLVRGAVRAGHRRSRPGRTRRRGSRRRPRARRRRRARSRRAASDAARTTRRVGRARRGAGTNARRRRDCTDADASAFAWAWPANASGNPRRAQGGRGRRRRRRRTAPARGAGGSRTCRRPGAAGTRRGVWSGWDSPRGPHGVRQEVRGGVLAVQVRGEVRAHATARARGAVRLVDAARKAGLKQEDVERRGERGGRGPHGRSQARRARRDGAREATTVGRSERPPPKPNVEARWWGEI